MRLSDQRIFVIFRFESLRVYEKKMLIGIISVTSFRLPQIHASSTQILYQTTKSSETTGLKMILQDFRIWRKYAENETFSGKFDQSSFLLAQLASR